MQTATRHFQTISATLRELNQAGLRMQTVNDLLTMYVGAASQHALRTTLVPSEAADSYKEIVAYWSQLAGRDVTVPLFHLPLRMGGLGVGSAVHRHAAAPWTAWHSIIPTLMAATDSPDTDSLFAATPILRGQLRQLQVTVSQQMDTPSLLLKSLGAALRTHGTQKVLVNTIQQVSHQQLLYMSLNEQHPESHPHLPNSQKKREHTCNNPAVKPTRRTTDASKSHSLDDSCYPTQPLATQPAFHPHAPTLVLPNAHALAPSTIINYTV